MREISDINGKLAIDARGLDSLRLQAKKYPEKVTKAVAQQFEAVFMQTLLKSMRDATPQDGLMDSDQTRMYTSMLDQQMAQSLSAKGIGLADVMLRQLTNNRVLSTGIEQTVPQGGGAAAIRGIESGIESNVRQLTRNHAASSGAEQTAPLGGGPKASPGIVANSRELTPAPAGSVAIEQAVPPAEQAAPNGSGSETMVPPTIAPTVKRERVKLPPVELKPLPVGNPPLAPVSSSKMTGARAAAPHAGRDFLSRMKDHAIQASSATGIPAQFLLGHAALESGWGKHEIRAADGSQSFNLFGIKAGRNWKGPSVDVMTVEYVNGAPRKMMQKFRAYASYADAFQDYAGVMRSNPRYAAVLNQRDSAGFAQGLQRAGYATDPQYADKLTRVLNGMRLRQTTMT